MAVSVNNYTIGKGIVSFKPEGGSYRDLGNCPEFEFTPSIEKLEHFSSRAGVKERDKTDIISKSGTLRIVMDEWSAENVALAVLGTENSSGVIEIFSESSIRGSVKIVGSSDIGVNYTWEFFVVDFIPSSSLSLISEEYGTMELSGEVSADPTLGFGTITPVA